MQLANPVTQFLVALDGTLTGTVSIAAKFYQFPAGKLLRSLF